MSGRPVAYGEVVVTARIRLAPGTDAEVAANWLYERFVEGRAPRLGDDWPPGVGPIDWSFEVVRRED
jgi:hypothetical protein